MSDASKIDDGGAAALALTNGVHALVSSVDFQRLSQFRWRLGHNGYVYLAGGRAKGRPCLLHRIVMDAPTGHDVHHIDENKLNCRRSNLLLVTPQEHQRFHLIKSVERSRAARKYPLMGTCKVCGEVFVAHPSHRGRQVCCSKQCGVRLAIGARMEKYYASQR